MNEKWRVFFDNLARGFTCMEQNNCKMRVFLRIVLRWSERVSGFYKYSSTGFSSSHTDGIDRYRSRSLAKGMEAGSDRWLLTCDPFCAFVACINIKVRLRSTHSTKYVFYALPSKYLQVILCSFVGVGGEACAEFSFLPFYYSEYSAETVKALKQILWCVPSSVRFRSWLTYHTYNTVRRYYGLARNTTFLVLR